MPHYNYVGLCLNLFVGKLPLDGNYKSPKMLVSFIDQRTIGPENAHLKPDLGVLSHNEMTLTLNTHTPLLTS